jgi:Family of unknown function (DUF6463)
MHPVRAEPTTMEHVMRITKPTRFPERRGVRLTKAAGWIAIAFGAVHVITAPLESRPRDIWSQVVDEGWWNTFTLDKATTLAELERSETFWVTLGSFGVPVPVLGLYIEWATRQRQRVPGWIGWILLAWALPFVTALPASPGWALAVSGGLIVLGDGRRSRATPLRSGHESWSKEEEVA